MPHPLTRYLAPDRLDALRRRQPLPERSDGAVLVADIGGFSALTRELTQALGPRAGAEELSRRVDAVYEQLIGCVQRWGGSVVGFAGDALSVWFDDGEGAAAGRAVACARALHEDIASFDGLRLKVAVAAGPVRRLVAGDPAVQRLELLAGATVQRVSELLAQAQAGQTWLDERAEAAAAVAAAQPQPAAPAAQPQTASLQPWLLPAVWRREQAGYGAFLTELRPTVALFLGFGPLDYEGDERAEARLQRVVEVAQREIEAQGGSVLQLTVDDKGSYLYGSFGAPTAHEDDPVRAVRAAKALMQALHGGEGGEVRIGLGAGVARTGAYGASTRAAYGALGEHVNLAARLMALAAPGQVLGSPELVRRTAGRSAWQPLGERVLKGWVKPVAVHALTTAERPTPTPAPVQALVGRQAERDRLAAVLQQARQGRTQAIALVGDAGIGKSRLLEDALHRARTLGYRVHLGECDAVGRLSPYLPWRAVWRGLLALGDADGRDPRRVLASLQRTLDQWVPARRPAAPLIAALLGVPVPENDFTASLLPLERRNVLAATLTELLHAQARATPLLIALEDLHWADALSLQLLDELARPAPGGSLVFVLAWRPSDEGDADRLHLLEQPHCERLALQRLAPAETEALVAARVGAGMPRDAVRALAARLDRAGEGNPFYLEELLHYLDERGAALEQVAGGIQALDLPDTLHALVLARVDRLLPQQQATLKAASVIGRTFAFRWLQHYDAQDLGEPEAIGQALQEMSRLGLTPVEAVEPELRYTFRHAVTHDVAYNCLPQATRRRLHGQLARFLEGADEGAALEVLAHHWGQTDDEDKQRDYFWRAGQAAQAKFANDAALDYYERLAPLLQAGERAHALATLKLRLGQVLMQMARWADARAVLEAGWALAARLDDPALANELAAMLGDALRPEGQLDLSLQWLERAAAGWRVAGDTGRYLQALWRLTSAHANVRRAAAARGSARRAVHVARRSGQRAWLQRARADVEVAAVMGGRHRDPLKGLERATRQALDSGDVPRALELLPRLGFVAHAHHARELCRWTYLTGLDLARQRGDVRALLNCSFSLGYLQVLDGDADGDRLMDDALARCAELGYRTMEVSFLLARAQLQFEQSQIAMSLETHRRALAVAEQALPLPGGAWTQASATLGIADCLLQLGHAAEATAAWRRAIELGLGQDDAYLRKGLLDTAANLLMAGSPGRGLDLARVIGALDVLAERTGTSASDPPARERREAAARRSAAEADCMQAVDDGRARARSDDFGWVPALFDDD